MSNNLVEWLRVQLDEDERTARATLWEGSGNKPSWELMASATIDVGGDEFYVGDRTIANHMMAWEPARVLREIDAKRQVLTGHDKAVQAVEDLSAVRDRLHARGRDVFMTEMDLEAAIHRRDALGGVVRLLALPYADRPGYREEWRP
jgi:hypothetical protein